MIQLGDICTKASSGIAQKDLEHCNGAYPIYGASGLIKYVDFYQQENPYVAVVKDGAGVGRVMQLPAKSSVIGTMQYIIPNEGISVQYLAYAMEHMNLAKYYTGATIPHIYFKDYCKEKLQAHNTDEQRHIALVLGKIAGLISLRKQQLAKLDELVKARFMEMFGDPVTNPYNWEQVPLKTSAIRLSDGPFGSNLKSEHYVQSGIRVIRLGNIGVGEFIDKDKSFISKEHYEQLKKYTCKPGEIVIGTLGDPNLRACIVPEYLGIAINKADCVHYVPKSGMLLADFVCQYINCPETLLLAASMVHGQTRSRISSGQLADLPIFMPPIEIQKEFTCFYQAKNRQKLTIQQSLDKLEMLRKSLMQEYFG